MQRRRWAGCACHGSRCEAKSPGPGRLGARVALDPGRRAGSIACGSARFSAAGQRRTTWSPCAARRGDSEKPDWLRQGAGGPGRRGTGAPAASCEARRAARGAPPRLKTSNIGPARQRRSATHNPATRRRRRRVAPLGAGRRGPRRGAPGVRRAQARERSRVFGTRAKNISPAGPGRPARVSGADGCAGAPSPPPAPCSVRGVAARRGAATTHGSARRRRPHAAQPQRTALGQRGSERRVWRVHVAPWSWAGLLARGPAEMHEEMLIIRDSNAAGLARSGSRSLPTLSGDCSILRIITN